MKTLLKSRLMRVIKRFSMDHLLFTSSNIVQFKIIECYHLLFV